MNHIYECGMDVFTEIVDEVNNEDYYEKIVANSNNILADLPVSSRENITLFDTMEPKNISHYTYSC